MVTADERRLALDLLIGRRAIGEAPEQEEQGERALIQRYLQAKANPGPSEVTTNVRSGVTIYRDERGIPHIGAESFSDLFFAHGYAQAQDRLWQLDYLRRWAHGRLAEVVGREKLGEDIVAHTIGIPALAAAMLENAHPDSREMFEAFASGVNAWMATLPAGLPVEFELLDYEPEPWTAVDSLAILKRWTWYLTGRLPVISTPECVRAVIGEREGEFYQPDGPLAYIVPPGNYDPEPRWPGLPMAEPEPLAWGPQEPGGSNNWAIAPELTAAGHAMVGSDPHVYFAVPSDCYEVHLHGAGLDVAGTAYAGMPIPRIGRNATLAWGITNNICMLRDLYVERLDPASDDRYLDGDDWKRIEHRSAEIQVRDEAAHRLDIRFAHDRPIVDHLVAEAALPKNLWPPDRGADTALSLAWVGFELSDEPKAFLDLCRAGTVEDGRRALAGIRCATWNYVLADSTGAIAYQCTGSIPLRGRTYRGYRDANDPIDAWVGYIPFDGLPRLIEPARGWVASANNPAAPPDFPYPLSGTWMVEDRAARAERLIAELQPHTPGTFAEMQNDVLSGRAVRGIPPLLEVLEATDDPRFRKPIELLRAWDRQLAIDAAGASLFFVFLWRWHQHVIRQRFPDDLAMLVQDAGGGLSASLLHGDRTGWFETDELRRETIVTAMRETLDWLSERLGPDPSAWAWGRIHRLGAVHPAARTALQHELLDIPPRSAPGGPGTLNSSHYVPPGTFDTKIGAIYRVISGLGPDIHTQTVSWPGQSGQPGSPHYADQVERHLAGDYFSLPFQWHEVEARATSTTRLDPSSS
ncbi:MAG TPA: penicillin acylase family protein [Thermomicrobiales bacterium]|nr:penicillin acylase family protein [Thermomicrobiales bacterium]